MGTPFDDVLAGFRLGDSETLLRLDGLDDFLRAQTVLVQQARRELFILTPDLEPDRYNSAEFSDLLSAFVRRHRNADARLLIGDPAIALRWGHRVVNLGRRLTTRLQIRRLHEDDFDPEEAWMVADAIGLLRRDGMDGFKGMLSAKAIPHAQRAAQRFEALWERSQDIPDFRHLAL